jgi:hypothetical protein
MTKIFEEITAERRRQNEKWGEQNHSMNGINGLNGEFERALQRALEQCRKRCETKLISWYDILMEEVCEAFLEREHEKQREEMVQVAAVAVQIIEYLDRQIKEANNAGN